MAEYCRAAIAHQATSPAPYLGSSDTSRGRSSPAPLAAFSNRHWRRYAVMKTRRGSHPKTTEETCRGPASNVKRLDTSRPVSISHTSVFPCTVRTTATRLPSGANSGPLSPASSGGPTVPCATPARSTQVSCRRSPTPVRCASTPVADTANAPAVHGLVQSDVPGPRGSARR